jgi:colanic acid/amylovoran biosynthesis protein
MNFNTPAIALNYEHKSEGIMQQLGLPQYSKPISSLFDGSLKQEVFSVLNDIEQQKIIVQECVIKERARVTDMVAFTLKDINAN